MRKLLALLDGGTHGTLAEPSLVQSGIIGNRSPVQILRSTGNFGTCGTLELDQEGRFDDLAKRVAELAEVYAERMAIVLEAGDIGEGEARRIAEAEIGAGFVRLFISSEGAA